MKRMEVAKRIAQWKWLIVDEISMVSAQFLAELDMQLRAVMSEARSTKRDAGGRGKPFGGINVLFCGDFYQLEPPSGTPLNALPSSWLRRAKQYAPGPTEDHGHHIFWGTGEGSVQGMTELTECMRARDPWLLAVQEEFRKGELTRNTHAFLHGEATETPGSWLNGSTQCGPSECMSRLSEIARDNALECSVCARERAARRLVATGADDARFRERVFGGHGDFSKSGHEMPGGEIASGRVGARNRETNYVGGGAG